MMVNRSETQLLVDSDVFDSVMLTDVPSGVAINEYMLIHVFDLLISILNCFTSKPRQNFDPREPNNYRGLIAKVRGFICTF